MTESTKSPQASGESHAQTDTMNQHGKPDDDQARGYSSQTTNWVDEAALRLLLAIELIAESPASDRQMKLHDCKMAVEAICIAACEGKS